MGEKATSDFWEPRQGEMYRKGLSEPACWSGCVNPSPLRVLGCGGSKDGFHSFTSGFLFAHTLSCQTPGCKHSCLFIYYFATIRIQWWLLKTFILLFQWRQSSSKVVGALRGLARIGGLSFGWEAPTNLSKAQGGQLWPFGAVCMGCIKPNDVCLGFSNFFFFSSDQYVQLPLLRPFASLLRMLLFSSHNSWDEWIRLIDRLASLVLT